MQIKKQLKTELKSQQETQKSDTVQTVTFRDKRYQAKYLMILSTWKELLGV